MKVLDLFSGIGGFSLGFERAGIKTSQFVEIDEHCQKVLKKNFPTTPIHGDIKTFKPDRYFDVICGGFPCQDVSVAGKQKGLNENTRSGLWIEYKRIIKEVKPRWVVIENVRNLLNNGFATVLQDLHEIGYDAEWEVISARSVGACHLRERIWIVAYPNNARWLRENSSQSKEWRSNIEFTRNSREKNRINTASHPSVLRCFQHKGQSQEVQSGRHEGLQREENKQSSMPESLHGTNKNEYMEFRFWGDFDDIQQKSKWWTKATSSFRDWWETESSICRVDDGISSGLDKGRAQRIKQLGNSIVPQIAELIAKRIIHHEDNKND